jgi:hypothetical protein
VTHLTTNQTVLTSFDFYFPAAMFFWGRGDREGGLEGTKLNNGTPIEALFTFIIIVFISEHKHRGICCDRLEFAHAGRVSSCGGSALAADLSFERCDIRCLRGSLFAGYSYTLSSLLAAADASFTTLACLGWFSSILHCLDHRQQSSPFSP